MLENERLGTLVDEREEKMMLHTGKLPTLRLARFLKPSIDCSDEVPPSPKTKLFHHKNCSFTVQFKGWKSQPRKWKQWVDQLKPRHEDLWKKISIYDSILISTYEFPKDEALVLGLAESWCPDTNTFVFPWGEATMTLEDMVVIGGFSVLGNPVISPLRGESVGIEEQLIGGYMELVRSSARKAHQSAWINLFMGRNGDLEHAAFLSFWLSRYVFPSKAMDIIHKQVFPIAVHLSQSTRIALAPAVLASLYRDMRVMKEQLDTKHVKDLSATICAPFIIQLWGWERYSSLQPTPNSISLGEPRAARWNRRKSVSTTGAVRRSINSNDDFQWRPYCCDSDNWRHPFFNREQGQWVIGRQNTSDELLSFARCIVPCELVGLDCIEQYVPHRVGMQFGMDQDIPGPVPRVNADPKIAWRTYDKLIQNFSLYIPPKYVESNITSRYFKWWNSSSSIKHENTNIVSVCRINSSSHKASTESSESESSIHPPGFPSKRWKKQQCSSDEDKMTISEWYNHQQANVEIKDQTPTSFLRASVQTLSSTTNVKANGQKLVDQATDNQSLKDPIENVFTVAGKVNEGSSNNSCTEVSMEDDYTFEVEGELNADAVLPLQLEVEARVNRLDAVLNGLNEAFSLLKAKKTSLEVHSKHRYEI
ncbi:hypothetical protein ACHQM5_010683 [Ranunculus cassubicifolius]